MICMMLIKTQYIIDHVGYLNIKGDSYVDKFQES